jgi:hypothetical protein
MLNAIVAINPDAVKEARNRDKTNLNNDHAIYGIPILIKTTPTWKECLPPQEHTCCATPLPMPSSLPK